MHKAQANTQGSSRIQVDNKKLYLIPDTTESNSANNSIKYAVTTTVDTKFNYSHYSHCTRNIITNSWLDQPMLFIPLSFPKSGLRFAEPPEQLTACPQEVQLSKQPRAPPVAALLRNAYGDVYITDFGIPATVTNAVKKVRRLKVSSDSTEPAKQLRVLLLKQYPSLRLPKNR